MANVNSFSQTVDASGQLRLANANFLYLIAATASVTISLQKGGSTEIFQNAIGGLQLGRVKGWDWAFFNAAPGTVLTFYYGITILREDVTVLQQQIATIAGTVPITNQPASTIATPAAVAVVTATASTVAANLLRRRITVSALSTNTGSLFIQAVGAGAGRGIELQPGTFVEIDNTSAFDLRNDTGANQTYSTFEET